MRVVLGVQFAAPRQVSRTKTWRRPLFPAVTAFAWVWFVFAPLAEAGLGVTARKATNRPELLSEGKIASVPASLPSSSVDASRVFGWQAPAAPMQVSRR